MNPTKFQYNEDLATLFFLHEGNLWGMPMWGEGQFDLDESFLVEPTDESVEVNGTTIKIKNIHDIVRFNLNSKEA